MTRCLIALGGNVGNVRETFARALDRLDDHPHISVAAASRCFLTEPVGSDSGDAYLNSAVALDTSLTPPDLQEATKQVEVDLGRERDHATWAPRTVDLDLVTCGDVVATNDRLRIPHPGCWYRRFVLDPVCRIAANTVHPGLGITFAALRQRLLPRPLPVFLDVPDRQETIDVLEARFPQVAFVDRAEDVAESGLHLPGSLPCPDSLVDILTAATGGVELAESIPGWDETPQGSEGAT